MTLPRRLAVPLATLLLATPMLAAGCAIEVKADSIPVPFSVAPTPSASAGVPEYVCTAAYKILTDGAVRLAGHVSASGASAEQGIRDTFTEMAAQVNAEATRTSDAELQQALRAVAADLTAAAGGPDPKSYATGGFETLGQKLDAAC